jgi:hypothetical protein
LAPRPSSISGASQSLLGPAVEHGDRAARRVVLRGDLEAAQVRCEKQDAAAGGPGLFHQLPAAHLDHAVDHFLLRAQPDLGQLQQRFSGLGNGGVTRVVHAGLHDVGGEIAPVGGRRQPGQPAGERAEVMQHGQRQAGEETEQGG